MSDRAPLIDRVALEPSGHGPIMAAVVFTEGGGFELRPLQGCSDAQREACEAYIVSQRHAGWIALSDMYDDGGLSGGTMERQSLVRRRGILREQGY